MGQAISSTFSECLGWSMRYSRAPTGPRRVEAGGSESGGQSSTKMRRRPQPQPASGIASTTTIPPPPPPLVPDKNAVYNLVDDEEEDICPTCLEPYTAENPEISTECSHSFHLQCILEWQTRSGSTFCPICAAPMRYREVGAKPA